METALACCPNIFSGSRPLTWAAEEDEEEGARSRVGRSSGSVAASGGRHTTKGWSPTLDAARQRALSPSPSVMHNPYAGTLLGADAPAAVLVASSTPAEGKVAAGGALEGPRADCSISSTAVPMPATGDGCVSETVTHPQVPRGLEHEVVTSAEFDVRAGVPEFNAGPGHIFGAPAAPPEWPGSNEQRLIQGVNKQHPQWARLRDTALNWRVGGEGTMPFFEVGVLPPSHLGRSRSPVPSCFRGLPFSSGAIDVDRVATFSEQFPWWDLREYVLNSFRSGFSIECTWPTPSSLRPALVVPDYEKSEDQHRIMDVLITEQFKHGLCISIPDPHSQPGVVVSPVHIHITESKPKGRPCTNASATDNSPNAFIDPYTIKTRLPDLSALLRVLTIMGPLAGLLQLDVEDAFGNLRINYDDVLKCGFHWRDRILFTLFPAFGLRSSPGIFCAAFCLLKWAALTMVIRGGFIFHPGEWQTSYLDDMFAVTTNVSRAHNLLDRLKTALRLLGARVKDVKCKAASKLKLLGYWVDAANQTISVDPEKRDDVCRRIHNIVNNTLVSYKQVASLIGLVIFCLRAMPPSGALLSNLFFMLRTMRPGDSRRLNNDTVDDLRSLAHIFKEFSSRNFTVGLQTHLEVSLKYDLVLSSDAAGRTAAAGVNHNSGDCCHVPFRAHQRVGSQTFRPYEFEQGDTPEKLSIALLEMFALVLTVTTMARTLCDSLIIIHVDNETCCHAWARGWSRVRPISRLMAKLQFFLMKRNLVLHVKWVNTADNIFADKLSRCESVSNSLLIPLSAHLHMPMQVVRPDSRAIRIFEAMTQIRSS